MHYSYVANNKFYTIHIFIENNLFATTQIYLLICDENAFLKLCFSFFWLVMAKGSSTKISIQYDFLAIITVEGKKIKIVLLMISAFSITPNWRNVQKKTAPPQVFDVLELRVDK